MKELTNKPQTIKEQKRMIALGCICNLISESSKLNRLFVDHLDIASYLNIRDISLPEEVTEQALYLKKSIDYVLHALEQYKEVI